VPIARPTSISSGPRRTATGVTCALLVALVSLLTAAGCVVFHSSTTTRSVPRYSYDTPRTTRVMAPNGGGVRTALRQQAGGIPRPSSSQRLWAFEAATTFSRSFTATNTAQFWPGTPEELDAMLGTTGRRVPDGPTTPGRGKVIWDLPNGKRITNEAHPYHTDAPAFHREPHYHVDQAGASNHSPSGRRLPGDPFDC
jgi:hypothetical protein